MAGMRFNGYVATVCHGQFQRWDSRSDAVACFTEGMNACDGAERERYADIVADLARNRPLAWDGREIPVGFEKLLGERS